MPQKISFTKAALDALPRPARGRLSVYDSKTPGLTASLTARGVLTFYLYRRIDGRPARVALGRYPAMTIEQARKAAERMNGEIAAGQNPQASRRRARGEPTLEELFEYYLEQHAKPRKKTWGEDKRQFDKFLANWRTRKISTIQKPDVQQLHNQVGKDSGPYAANRLLALISTIFNQASDLGVDQANPARGVKRFQERSRERFVEADELPRFFAALAEEENATLRDFFAVALLTGARRANVQEMRWEQIHWQRGVWEIPKTKSGDALTLPLSAEAIGILAQRRGSANGCPWVFPSRSKTGHLVEPKTAWRRILNRAGIKNLRIHDLRRTLGSWQAASGSSLPIIGKSLGHKNQSTTAIYARLNLDPVRESVQRATAAMLSAARLSLTDNETNANAANDA